MPTRRSTPLCRRSFLRNVAVLVGGAARVATAAPSGLRFSITVDPALRAEPLTGRFFLFVSRQIATEPRLQYDGLADSVPFFGCDVNTLRAGHGVTIDVDTPGYPLASLRDLPAGTYTIQALANVYTRFARADGNTIWAHADRGEGQQFTHSPGNLTSVPQRMHLDPTRSQSIAVRLTQRIPAIPPRPDTALVKHVRLQSRLLTRFWGRPIFLGAIVLLPASYTADGDRRYPTVYEQDHFSTDPPLGFDPFAAPETPAQQQLRVDTTNDGSPVSAGLTRTHFRRDNADPPPNRAGARYL